MSQADDDTLPGQTGDGVAAAHGVRVYDVPAAVATAEFAIDEFLATTGSRLASAVWLSFMADQPFHIITGQTGIVPVPDPAARWNGGPGVNPAQQTIRIPADYEWMRKWTRQTAPAYRMIGDGTNAAVVRVERVSIMFGGSNEGG